MKEGKNFLLLIFMYFLGISFVDINVADGGVLKLWCIGITGKKCMITPDATFKNMNKIADVSPISNANAAISNLCHCKKFEGEYKNPEKLIKATSEMYEMLSKCTTHKETHGILITTGRPKDKK